MIYDDRRWKVPPVLNRAIFNLNLKLRLKLHLELD